MISSVTEENLNRKLHFYAVIDVSQGIQRCSRTPAKSKMENFVTIVHGVYPLNFVNLRYLLRSSLRFWYCCKRGIDYTINQLHLLMEIPMVIFNFIPFEEFEKRGRVHFSD